MPYIGKEPANSFISFEKQVFTIVNSQTAYTLDNAVTNENDIRLVINNIVQEPGSGKAYTASGTTLTLSAALVNGTDEMYCVFLGKAVQTVNPANASVGASQLAADAVTTAKIADDAVTSAKLTYPLTTFSSTGIDDNASANSITIDSNGHVTMPLQSAVHAYPNTAQDNMSTGIVTIALGAEIYDVNSDFDTSSSTFTAPVTGKYQVNASVTISDIDTAYHWMYGVLLVSSNRNYYLQQIQPRYEITQDYSSYGRGFNASTLVDMDANDTLLLKVRHSSHGSAQHDVVVGSASAPETFLTVHLAC
tara:strand:- start:1340 stop:2257 length:918 start_codon:yes stop_codon:yes gene_type:complete